MSSRSPSPSGDSDFGETHPKVEEDNPDLLKDKLREIIQTATGQYVTVSAIFPVSLSTFFPGLDPHSGSTSDETSPTTPQEMYYPPMMANGEPNLSYSVPPQMMQGPNNFYPNDPNMQPMGPVPQQGMMMGPHMIPPNEQYHSNWRPAMGRPRGHHMEPPRGGGIRPPMPPRFHRGYRGNGPWRPREAWRGQGPRIPGKKPAEALSALLAFIFTDKFIELFCLKFRVLKIKHKNRAIGAKHASRQVKCSLRIIGCDERRRYELELNR